MTVSVASYAQPSSESPVGDAISDHTQSALQRAAVAAPPRVKTSSAACRSPEPSVIGRRQDGGVGPKDGPTLQAHIAGLIAQAPALSVDQLNSLRNLITLA